MEDGRDGKLHSPPGANDCIFLLMTWNVPELAPVFAALVPAASPPSLISRPDIAPSLFSDSKVA